MNVPYQKETNDLKGILSNKFGILREDDTAPEGVYRYYIEKRTRPESYYISITLNEDGFVCGLYIIHRIYDILSQNGAGEGSVYKVVLCDTYIDKDILEKSIEIAHL